MVGKIQMTVKPSSINDLRLGGYHLSKLMNVCGTTEE
jgi:hypothetical protein